jgi:hypothetical protein
MKVKALLNWKSYCTVVGGAGMNSIPAHTVTVTVDGLLGRILHRM